jgi:prophage DNA circulation protein
MATSPTSQSRLNASPVSVNAAEGELKSSLTEQSSVFENAVALIERLESAANRRELGSPDSVVQLQKSLDQVVSAQKIVSAAHHRFTQAKATLSHDVRQALTRHEELLKNLITRIDRLQETFQGMQAELTPQLDSDSRRRNMQSAYQRSMKSV